MLVYLCALPVYYWLGFAHLLAAVRQLSPCPLSCVLAAAWLYTAQWVGKSRGEKGMVSLCWHRHKGIPSPGLGPAHSLTPLSGSQTHSHSHTLPSAQPEEKHSRLFERQRIRGTVKFNFTAWRWRSWVRWTWGRGKDRLFAQVGAASLLLYFPKGWLFSWLCNLGKLCNFLIYLFF